VSRLGGACLCTLLLHRFPYPVLLASRRFWTSHPFWTTVLPALLGLIFLCLAHEVAGLLGEPADEGHQ
jgi:hypothetical protein